MKEFNQQLSNYWLFQERLKDNLVLWLAEERNQAWLREYVQGIQLPFSLKVAVSSDIPVTASTRMLSEEQRELITQAVNTYTTNYSRMRLYRQFWAWLTGDKGRSERIKHAVELHKAIDEVFISHGKTTDTTNSSLNKSFSLHEKTITELFSQMRNILRAISRRSGLHRLLRNALKAAEKIPKLLSGDELSQKDSSIIEEDTDLSILSFSRDNEPDFYMVLYQYEQSLQDKFTQIGQQYVDWQAQVEALSERACDAWLLKKENMQAWWQCIHEQFGRVKNLKSKEELQNFKKQIREEFKNFIESLTLDISFNVTLDSVPVVEKSETQFVNSSENISDKTSLIGGESQTLANLTKEPQLTIAILDYLRLERWIKNNPLLNEWFLSLNIALSKPITVSLYKEIIQKLLKEVVRPNLANEEVSEEAKILSQAVLPLLTRERERLRNILKGDIAEQDGEKVFDKKVSPEEQQKIMSQEIQFIHESRREEREALIRAQEALEEHFRQFDVHLEEVRKDIFEKTDMLRKDIQEVKNGIGEVKNGIEEVKNGIGEVNNGIGEVKNGIEEVKNGIGEVNNGIGEVNNGIEEVNNGIEEVKNGIGEVNNGIGEVNNGIGEVNNGIEEIKTDIHGVNIGTQKARGGIRGLKEGIAAINARMIRNEQQSSERMSDLEMKDVQTKNQIAFLVQGLQQMFPGMSAHQQNVGLSSDLHTNTLLPVTAKHLGDFGHFSFEKEKDDASEKNNNLVDAPVLYDSQPKIMSIT